MSSLYLRMFRFERDPTFFGSDTKPILEKHSRDKETIEVFPFSLCPFPPSSVFQVRTPLGEHQQNLTNPSCIRACNSPQPPKKLDKSYTASGCFREVLDWVVHSLSEVHSLELHQKNSLRCLLDGTGGKGAYTHLGSKCQPSSITPDMVFELPRRRAHTYYRKRATNTCIIQYLVLPFGLPWKRFLHGIQLPLQNPRMCLIKRQHGC